MFLSLSSSPPDQIQFAPSDAVDLQGHCVFCLKACFQSLEGSDNTRTPRLVTFSHIWPYLQPKDERKTGRLSRAKYFFVFGGKDVVVSGEDTSYSEVPPMCTSCYEQVLKMNDLHLRLTKLKKEVEAQAVRLREIVAESREQTSGDDDESRSEERRLEISRFFEKVLEEGMGRTKQFLDDLQGKNTTVNTKDAVASEHQLPGIRGSLTCTVPMVRCDQLPPRSLKKSSLQKSSRPSKRKSESEAFSLQGPISSLTAKFEKRRKELALRTVSRQIRGFSDIVASMIPPPTCSSSNPIEIMPVYPEVKREPADHFAEEESMDDPSQEEGQKNRNSPDPLEDEGEEVFEEGGNIEVPPDPEEEVFESHLENLGNADLSDDPSYSPSENESNISTDDDSSDQHPACVPKTPLTPARSKVKKAVRKINKPKTVTKETKKPAEARVRKRKYTKKPKDVLAPPKSKLRKEFPKPLEAESNISSEDDSSEKPKVPVRSQVRKAVVRKGIKETRPSMKETKDPAEKKVRKRKYTRRKPTMRMELHAIKQNCDVCNVWMSRGKIYEHMRTHIQDYAMKCPNSNCGACYLSPVRLERRHLIYHRECLETQDGTKFPLMKKCEACDFECRNSPRFRGHLNRHETATKNFTCPMEGCGEKFTLRQSVQFHLDVHLHKTPRRVQKCVVCRKGIPLEGIAEHYKSLHDAQEIIKCGSCNFLFPTREYLFIHARSHQREGIVCEICADSSTKFKLPKALRQHCFEAHGIGNKLVCEYCSKGFWLEKSLQTHKNLYHLSGGAKPVYKRKRSYKCDLCVASVEFKMEQTLFTHKIRVHGAEPYGCQTCEEKFNTLSALRTHETVHSGAIIPQKETYTCEGCGKVIRSKYCFRTHVLTCVGNADKSHICDTCGRGYVTAYLLRRHKKEAHSGFRHVCDICGKGLTGKLQLSRHQMIHTGERPLACHICDQRFRYKEALTRHLAAHEKYGDKFQPQGPRERGVRKGNKTNDNFELSEFV